VPHATDLIISWIKEVAQRPVDGTNNVPDVCLIEVFATRSGQSHCHLLPIHPPP
jgi:CTP synthase